MKISAIRVVFVIVAAAILLTLIAGISSAFLIDLWWFDTLDLTYYFISRQLYRDLIVISVTILFTALIFINLYLVPVLTNGNSFRRPQTETGESGSSLNSTHFFSAKILLPLSAVLSLPILFPVYNNWETCLLYFFSVPAELKDPVYGRNISYYLFSFPAYTLLQKELLLTFSLLLAVTGGLYWYAYQKHKDRMDGFPKAAKLHLTILITIIIFVQAWAISFQKTELLYVGRHEPMFFGPGFVEMNYELLLIWLIFLAFLCAAGSAVYFIHTHRARNLLIGCFIVFLLLTGLRHITFIPGLIDKFYVQPNPVKTEKQYIQFNIDATLDAFDLNNIEQIDYPVASTLTENISTEIYQDLDNIPLWDHALLQNVLEQLQAIRPFYTFSPVAVDRYLLGGSEYQVNIAARELTQDKLPDEARNWENSHMKYTHGFGVVVSPAAQKAGQAMQWFVNEISLQTEFEKFKLTKPEIYYGLADYPYAIVPNAAPVSGGDNKDLASDYQGSGGLNMSSLITKLFVSAFFEDEKIFFSTSVTRQSKILFRRNIIERIHTIAPFLQLDANPYPVVIDKKIFWIIDAYTTSDRYPYVNPIPSPFAELESGQDTLNYIRNSVKIVVDAYNGSVDFYIADPTDPVIATYRRIFPTLFKTLAEIPPAFLKHLSYPQDLFAMQMAIYGRYHQTDPEVFYQQSEALESASMDGQPIAPYYLTIDIFDKPGRPESQTEKFILVNPFSPFGRENLKAIAIAGCLNIDTCNQQYAADIYVYSFPQSVQIDGPAQISALISQNPDISRYMTLWDQQGSKVIKGRMLILPIGESILYIQPVYLIASAKAGFPQLAKVIVAMNQQTAMGDTIEEAYKQVEKLSGR